MPDPSPDFLDTAVRGFEDNAELQIIAKRELEEAMWGAPETGDSPEIMQSRLDAVDRRTSRWQLWSVLAMAVTSLVLFAWTAWSFYSKRDEILWFDSIGDWTYYHDIPEEKLTEGLTSAQKLLLLGDQQARPEGDKMKPLWQSDPDNPVYLAEHARTWISKEKTMPSELWSECLRIDPDNGYHHYLAALAASHKVVEEIRPPRTPGSPKPAREYHILDEPGLNRSIDHLLACAAAPEFRSHEKELWNSRLELLPETDDILSSAPNADYIFGDKIAQIFSFSLVPIISAGAQECLRKGDRDRLVAIIRAWDDLLLRKMEDERLTAISALGLRSFVRMPLDNFIAAADGLGLEEEAKALRKKKEIFEQNVSPLAAAMGDTEAKRQAKLHGGLFLGSGLSVEPLSEEEIRPTRMAEYSLMDRIAALPGWTILALLSIFTVCYRFRANGLVKLLSARLSHLATERDHLWIIGWGVLFPFLLSLVLIHLTPLGGRAWNFHAHGGFIVFGQLLAIVFVMLLVPLILARRRLSQRAGRLGLHGGRSIFGWFAVSACVLAFPAFYIAQQVMVPNELMPSDGILNAPSFIDLDPGEAAMPGKAWLKVGIGLLAFAVVYGLISLLISLFSSRRQLLRRVILSRMLAPIYLAGTLVFAISMPILHAVERHWVTRDMSLKFLPENSGLGIHEARAIELDQQQLRRLLQESQ
ncbi:hypothetical protein OKA04_21695 [Luteolibacter flavescens]|uniref:Uncharacterized protein n=1 Tax=Luteolibacter flavescens TaxID=1859460 RepID=A0ABT3FUU6_9BACT|nr:hypothetical protein [Luteolibacter flavescens]